MYGENHGTPERVLIIGVLISECPDGSTVFRSLQYISDKKFL